MPNLRALIAVASLTVGLNASAFPVSSAITTPCHEPITMEALRNVRQDVAAAQPLISMNRDHRAMIEDLPFAVDDDMRDLGAVTLLLGVRDNDLKGRDPNEIDSLALVHGDPTSQHEHCLRSPEDDEPGGTQNALLLCRGFILEMFTDALEGLDGQGRPTVDALSDLAVALSLRGKLHVAVPRFYLRMGQGLHALQDGFTHTYRQDDRTRVTVTLNYVDVVNKEYLAERDGPGHSMELDRCDATDALRVRNRALAVEASTAVLRAALQPGTRAQKIAALEGVLDQYLNHQAGCTDSNGWCEAPEAELEAAAGCGCGAGSGLAMIGAALALLATRRRKLLGPVLALCLVVPITARAQEPEPEPAPTGAESVQAVEGAPHIKSEKAAEEGTTVPITADEVKAVQKEVAHQSLFAIYVAGGGSLYNGAVAGMIGLRLNLNDFWQLGLDGELNGWYGIHARKMRTGAANVYLTATVRYPLKYERINLRANVQLGVAVQMFDLVGVPTGSTGLFAGINPIGLEIKLTGHLYLIFYPLGFAMPVTQLKGAPFAFPQFRTTLGLEVSF